MSSCPKCGSVLANDRAGFCDRCGCNLRQSENQLGKLTSNSHEAESTQSWRNKSTQPDRASHPFESQNHGFGHQENLISSVSRAPDGLPSSPNEKSREEARQIVVLYINTNQFYMQGFSCVVDIKVENVSRDPIDSLEIELSGRLITKRIFEAQTGILRNMVERLSGSLFAKRISGPVVAVLGIFIRQLSGNLIGKGMSESFPLEPGQRSQRLFQIDEPRTGGIQLVHFRITARQGASVFAYRADTTLVVLNKVEDAKDIQINADNFLNLGQTSEKFNIGGVINIDIADKIKTGGIKTANDFMEEYKNLLPAYQRLNLEPDAPSRRRWQLSAAAAIVLVVFAISVGIWPDRTPKQEQGEVTPTARQESLSPQELRPVESAREQVRTPPSKTEPLDTKANFLRPEQMPSAAEKGEMLIKPEETQGEIVDTKPPPIIKKKDLVIEPEETEGDVNEPEMKEIIRRKDTSIEPEETEGDVNEPEKKEIIRKSDPSIEPEETEGDVNQPEKKEILRKKDQSIEPEETEGKIKETER